MKDFLPFATKKHFFYQKPQRNIVLCITFEQF